VFGGAEKLKDEAAQDSFVALVALPGYFVAVALIAKMGPRNVQVSRGVKALRNTYVLVFFSVHAGMVLLF